MKNYKTIYIPISIIVVVAVIFFIILMEKNIGNSDENKVPVTDYGEETSLYSYEEEMYAPNDENAEDYPYSTHFRNSEPIWDVFPIKASNTLTYYASMYLNYYTNQEEGVWNCEVVSGSVNYDVNFPSFMFTVDEYPGYTIQAVYSMDAERYYFFCDEFEALKK